MERIAHDEKHFFGGGVRETVRRTGLPEFFGNDRGGRQVIHRQRETGVGGEMVLRKNESGSMSKRAISLMAI